MCDDVSLKSEILLPENSFTRSWKVTTWPRRELFMRTQDNILLPRPTNAQHIF